MLPREHQLASQNTSRCFMHMAVFPYVVFSFLFVFFFFPSFHTLSLSSFPFILPCPPPLLPLQCHSRALFLPTTLPCIPRVCTCKRVPPYKCVRTCAHTYACTLKNACAYVHGASMLRPCCASCAVVRPTQLSCQHRSLSFSLLFFLLRYFFFFLPALLLHLPCGSSVKTCILGDHAQNPSRHVVCMACLRRCRHRRRHRCTIRRNNADTDDDFRLLTITSKHAEEGEPWKKCSRFEALFSKTAEREREM